MTRLTVVTVGVALVTLAGAIWSWSDARKSTSRVQTLEVRVAELRRDVAALRDLPELPALRRLPETLAEFLTSLPQEVTVRFTGEPNAREATFKDWPAIQGVRYAVLEITDPRTVTDTPLISLATAERWQGRWPLQVNQAVWSKQHLTTTVTLFGR